MEPLDINKVKMIKELSYKICKYSIPMNIFFRELLNIFIKNGKYTFTIKSRILKLITKAEYDITKSYRVLIHMENLLISIYCVLITPVNDEIKR